MQKSLFLLYLLLILIAVACTHQPTATNTKPLITDNIEKPVEKIEKKDEKQENNAVVPIKEFSSRITKKPFGIYITPKNSPVQPERFTGYHTGVDVEYGDIEYEVAIVAITDGIVERSEWVSGYGGVMAIRHIIDNKKYLAIYGHLNPDKLTPKGKNVIKGGQIGILGKGMSIETDGERKHLHFALYTGDDINLRGYVNNEGELSAWVDPVIFFPSF
jgi:hypothetical protein